MKVIIPLLISQVNANVIKSYVLFYETFYLVIQ
jgi:hypothetical protein